MKGTDEAVGGVVVARYGVSTIEVIERVEEKITALHVGLPTGVSIVPFYDRSALITRASETLLRSLLEEAVIVTLVNIVFLLNFRSVFIVTIPLPLAVLTAFLFMRYFGITSNIMSLAGIAIAIGVLVDAAIVVTENAFRLIGHRRMDPRDRRLVVATVLEATRVAAPYLLLHGDYHPGLRTGIRAHWSGRKTLSSPRLYEDLFDAWGKLLSVTLVPVLCSLLLGGKVRGGVTP